MCFQFPVAFREANLELTDTAPLVAIGSILALVGDFKIFLPNFESGEADTRLFEEN